MCRGLSASRISIGRSAAVVQRDGRHCDWKEDPGVSVTITGMTQCDSPQEFRGGQRLGKGRVMSDLHIRNEVS